MSSETLSRPELDPRTSAAPVGPARRGAQAYDFRRPSRVSKDKLRTIEAMYERLAKALEGWLIGRVRGQVEVRLQGIESLSFGEFAGALTTPCASYLFDIANSGDQQGVVDIGHDLAFFLVDRLFGGGASAVTTMERSLTPIERLAVRGLAERVTLLLQEIWADHVQLDVQLAGFETLPEILQPMNREDPVLVARLEVQTNELRSVVLLCLPFAVLDKFFAGAPRRRSDAIAGTEREREESRELTEASLRAAHVEVAARLPVFQLPLRALSTLHVGGILSTGIPRDAQIEVLVGEQRRFTGTAGRVGQKLAVRVAEAHHASDEDDAGRPPG